MVNERIFRLIRSCLDTILGHASIALPQTDNNIKKRSFLLLVVNDAHFISTPYITVNFRHATAILQMPEHFTVQVNQKWTFRFQFVISGDTTSKQSNDLIRFPIHHCFLSIIYSVIRMFSVLSYVPGENCLKSSPIFRDRTVVSPALSSGRRQF